MWWKISRRKSRNRPGEKVCGTSDRFSSNPVRLLGVASVHDGSTKFTSCPIATTTITTNMSGTSQIPSKSNPFVKSQDTELMKLLGAAMNAISLFQTSRELTTPSIPIDIPSYGLTHGSDTTTTTSTLSNMPQQAEIPMPDKDLLYSQSNNTLATTTSANMSHCLDIFGDLDNSMSFSTSTTAALQAVTVDTSQLDFVQSISNSNTAHHNLPPSFPQLPEESERHQLDHAPTETINSEAWKKFKSVTPFLAVPQEIHLKIISFLHPIDAICLSLVNRSMYNLNPPYLNRPPLDIGGPFSSHPYESPEGCKYCCPVLYHPAHCELSFHLRPFIPTDLIFCAGRCQKYTRCEQKGYADSKEYCGECGINYRRRYERGRRYLDKGGEKRLSTNKWFNNARGL